MHFTNVYILVADVLNDVARAVGRPEIPLPGARH